MAPKSPARRRHSYTAAAPYCGTETNATAVRIPDLRSATSSISVSGCDGYARADLKVEVHIKHPNGGDLMIDLITPGGQTINLMQSNGSDFADNVYAT